MADQDRILYLFEKYLQRKCNPSEVKELVHLLQSRSASGKLALDLERIWIRTKEEQKSYDVDWQNMYQHITSNRHLSISKNRKSKKRKIYAIAAVLTGLITISGILYISSHKYAEEKILPASLSTEMAHDVSPGGNKAILILSNGKKIILNRAANGNIAKQGNIQIIKLDSGELAYHASANNPASPAPIQYNTIETPVGGQFRVTLPDGTKVWLNAVSSIRFPTSFTTKERKVTVTGEVYFEVAENPSQPFIVNANNTQIKVLGTHFNVNAYSNEAETKTTLLEGSIKVVPVSNDKNALVIAPGEQAKVNSDGKIFLVKEADTDEIMGWKNGLFVFHDDDLQTVMRRLSRWYNIRVEYKNNNIPSSHFTGAIRREVNLSEVFKMLELTGGAVFDIEDKKVIVSE